MSETKNKSNTAIACGNLKTDSKKYPPYNLSYCFLKLHYNTSIPPLILLF